MKPKPCSSVPVGRSPNPRRAYRPKIDIRGIAARQRGPREFGALADRLYFGARGHGKCGVQHFHV